MPIEVFIRFRLAFDLILEASQKIEDANLLRYLKANPKKENEYRASPHNYQRILQIIQNGDYILKSSILENSKLSENYIKRIKLKLKLRDYQNEALDEFLENGGMGIIILPTAAGKTIIGIKAIEKLQQKTIIIVPTKNLLYQWVEHLTKYTSLSRELIGQLGDQIREVFTRETRS